MCTSLLIVKGFYVSPIYNLPMLKRYYLPLVLHSKLVFINDFFLEKYIKETGKVHYHHVICNNPSFHEPSDSCKCTLCDQLCERYHLERCKKRTRSIKDYASQGAKCQTIVTHAFIYGCLAEKKLLLSITEDRFLKHIQRGSILVVVTIYEYIHYRSSGIHRVRSNCQLVEIVCTVGHYFSDL